MMIDKRRQSAIVRVNAMPAILDRSDVVRSIVTDEAVEFLP